MIDGRELRDVLVGDYQKNARSRGVDPSTSDLERLAIGDLQLVDAANAAAAPPAPKKPAAPPPPSETASRVADSKGYAFERRSLPLVDVPAAPMRPLAAEGVRRMALIKRYHEMCAVSGDAAKSSFIGDRPYLYPDLALAIVEEHTNFTCARRRYRGLKLEDRKKAFIRAIEDLADKSTGRLGPWWVK